MWWRWLFYFCWIFEWPKIDVSTMPIPTGWFPFPNTKVLTLTFVDALTHHIGYTTYWPKCFSCWMKSHSRTTGILRHLGCCYAYVDDRHEPVSNQSSYQVEIFFIYFLFSFDRSVQFVNNCANISLSRTPFWHMALGMRLALICLWNKWCICVEEDYNCGIVLFTRRTADKISIA